MSYPLCRMVEWIAAIGRTFSAAMPAAKVTACPCRMMEPILDEIALEFEDRGVTIAKLDTEHAPDTAARFEIRSIPTLIFFRDGAPLFQLTGLVPKPVLERELGALLEGE